MAIPVNSRLLARLPRTAFKPGQSGNPRGRIRGSSNKVTREAREAAQRIVDDPEYREELRARMIAGTAGAMEPLMWFYAKGKPVDGVRDHQPNAFAELTNQELIARIATVLGTLTP